MARSKWVGGEGDWDEAADWSHGIPNGTDAAAIIKDRDSTTVNLAAGESFSVQRVHVENSNVLNVVGQLNFQHLLIDHNGTVNFAGDRSFNNGLIQFGTGLNFLRLTPQTQSLVMTLGPNEILKSHGGGGDVECGVVNQGLIKAFGPVAGLFLYNNVTNDGVIAASAGGVIECYSALTGSGEATLATGGTLDVEQVTSSQTINFLDGAGNLYLVDPTLFAGVVKGFQAGDTIDLSFTPASSVSLNDADLLTVSNGSHVVAQIQLTGIYSQSDFGVSSDGDGGTLITTAHPPAAVAILAQTIASLTAASSARDGGAGVPHLAHQGLATALMKP